jgi:hypothetical protein
MYSKKFFKNAFLFGINGSLIMNENGGENWDDFDSILDSRLNKC